MAQSDRISEDLPAVPSPYEGTQISHGQHARISAYWFATNFLWGALLVIMLPGEMRHLVPQFRVTALSLLTALSAVVALVVPLVAGAYSDRCASKWGRRRPYIVTGVVLNLIGLALMGATVTLAAPIHYPHGRHLGDLAVYGVLLQSPTFVIFLMAYIVVQLGNNIASAAYSGVIPDLVPEHQRGAASGYMALMSQLGTLLGAVGSGLLLGHQPESVKYIVLGVVLVSVAAITVFGIKETPLPVRPPKIQWGSYVKSLWIDPRKYPDFAWVWITRALVMLGFYAILPFINYYLVDVIGIEKPEGPASLLIGVILIFSSISGVLGGYISDRIGRKRVVYIANSMIAVTTIGFMFCHNIGHVLVVGSIFGLGFGAYTSVDWALGTDVLPSKKDAAKEMAVWHIAMTLPQSVGPVIAAYLIGMWQIGALSPLHPEDVHYAPQGYAFVFIFCSVCFGLGAYLLRNVRGVK